MTDRWQEVCSCFPSLANPVWLPLHMGLAPSILLENSADPILTTDQIAGFIARRHIINTHGLTARTTVTLALRTAEMIQC